MAVACRLILVALFLYPFSYAHAQEGEGVSSEIVLGAGIFEIFEGDGKSGDIRLEYRHGEPLFWNLRPWAGLELTFDGGLYGAGGLLFDWEFSPDWFLTPSIGAGLYEDGKGSRLGYTLQFRSQLELGYGFENGSRVSLGLGHISNASLGRSNPGAEILSLSWHVPVDWLQ